MTVTTVAIRERSFRPTDVLFHFKKASTGVINTKL